MARLPIALVCGVLTSVLVLAGCSRAETATPAAQALPPQVTVARVVSRQITDFADFTGHFEAVDRVEIRPRVSGYISSVNFVDGGEVRKGDVLFVIDPRPYEADLKRTQAQLAQARSQLALARSERDRAQKLIASRSISREEYETRVAASQESGANVEAAQAAVDMAALNLTFSRVTSPISGIVSRAEITAGNLVTSGQTLLTTVVSVDPIYVSFEGDEQGYLEFMDYARGNARDRAHAEREPHPVWIGLADESGYPHEGRIVFVDNEIDPSTGTVRARGRIDNHDRRFTPGMFARVRLPGSERYTALLVNDSAVGTDQGVNYVLRVGSGNKVEYCPVKLGPIIDGLRVVREGLAPGDLIVVNGLQRVHAGMPVTPERVAMGEQHTHDEPFTLGSGSGGSMLAHNPD